ncbi:hypothetical protein BDV97DRAFT_109559 [Delphinella strobiligena]|nr:hypothetical protein BDV97DRAFT_109559 [Delphinella strobiligena]
MGIPRNRISGWSAQGLRVAFTRGSSDTCIRPTVNADDKSRLCVPSKRRRTCAVLMTTPFTPMGDSCIKSSLETPFVVSAHQHHTQAQASETVSAEHFLQQSLSAAGPRSQERLRSGWNRWRLVSLTRQTVTWTATGPYRKIQTLSIRFRSACALLLLRSISRPSE